MFVGKTVSQLERDRCSKKSTIIAGAFLALRPSPSLPPGRSDRFCKSTVQQDNTRRSASDQGAADGARRLYTAKTHTTGGRESGVSRSSDGRLDIKLSIPDASGTGTNPEQLLAAGWSACFVSSIKIVAARMKVMLPADLAVDAEVDLGTTGGAYFLQARLNVRLPGLEREVAQALVDGAHETCPYTKATRDNISVVTNLIETGSVTVTEYLLTPWEVTG